MTNALVARAPSMAMGALEDPERLGNILAKSGFFSDTRDAAQAVVKVLAGAELGFGPIQSMTGVFIVKGRVTLSSGLIAAAVKRHPHYDYRVVEHTADACEIEFFGPHFVTGKRESMGSMAFTMDMAKRAGLASGENWRKYPEAMLFARTITSGARMFCPDVFGAPIYTPDELDASILVDAEGEVLGGGNHPPVIEEAKPIGRVIAENAAAREQDAPAASVVLDGRSIAEAADAARAESPPVATPPSVAARAAQYEAKTTAPPVERKRVVVEDVTPTNPTTAPPEGEHFTTSSPEHTAPNDPDAPLDATQMDMLKKLLQRDDGAASFVRFGLIGQGVDADNEEALATLTNGQAHEVISNAAKRFA